jgi:chromosome segregation ATPase
MEQMKSKIISLESKLSSTVTEKKKAVYNIEELVGKVSEDKKRNLEMYLDGERIYQKSIKTHLKDKKKLENEIKTLKAQAETQDEENTNLRAKANQYDLLSRQYNEKVEQCVRF